MNNTTGHLLRPCKSTAAYEALPDAKTGNLKLDLTICHDILGTIGYEEVCNAKVLLILKKEIEVTLYPNGKLILKTDSKNQAQRVMDEIYDLILNN